MKKVLVLTAVVLFAACVLASPLMAGKQDFEIVNKTGKTISGIYVSKTSTTDWEENLLEKDTLKNGETFDVSFEKEKSCKWDMLIVHSNGDKAVFAEMNLCEISKVTLKYEGGNPVYYQE